MEEYLIFRYCININAGSLEWMKGKTRVWRAGGNHAVFSDGFVGFMNEEQVKSRPVGRVVEGRKSRY